jgi:hypothetical protein
MTEAYLRQHTAVSEFLQGRWPEEAQVIGAP